MKQWELRGFTDVRTDVVDPLRSFMNQVPALFWTTDADLVLTSCLGAEFERSGLGPNQLVGTTLPDLFDTPGDEEGGRDVVDAHRQALAGASVWFGTRWSSRPFRARVAPLRDGSDQVIGTICVAVGDEEEARSQPHTARSSGYTT
jgi:hypothetical protein